MNDFREWESGPYFNAEGMFITEVDGKPVGMLEAYIDRKDRKRKASLNG